VTLAALSWVPNAKARAENQIVSIRFGACRVEVNRAASVAVTFIVFFMAYLHSGINRSVLLLLRAQIVGKTRHPRRK
jgi:hypothetical protein